MKCTTDWVAKFHLKGMKGKIEGNSSSSVANSISETPLKDPGGSNVTRTSEDIRDDLEQQIEGMKRNQKQVLAELHQEIDSLMRQNQKLQFKLSKVQYPETKKHTGKRLQRKTTAGGRRQLGTVAEMSNGGLSPEVMQIQAMNGSFTIEEPPEIRRIEKKIGEVKQALRNERCKRSQLLHRLKDDDENEEAEELSFEKASRRPSVYTDVPALPLPFGATVDPFLVHCYSHGLEMRRPPTIEECEVIFKVLQASIDKQSEELAVIKTDLKDVLQSHKLTPESYLLAKYYARDSSECNEADVQPNRRGSVNTTGRKPTKVVSFPGNETGPPFAKPPLQPISKPVLQPKKASGKTHANSLKRHPCSNKVH